MRSPDDGYERPAIAAQIREIDLERAGEIFIEDFGGAAQIGWDDRTSDEGFGAEPGLEVRRSNAQERGVELRDEIVGAGEEPDLRAFGRIGRRKPHASTSEQDDRGRTVRDLRDERGAGGHLDGHVGSGDGEIADVELTRGSERQAEEAGDVRDRLHAFDAPVVRIGLGGWRPDVDAPRGQLRLDAALDKHLDEQLTPVTFEREPVAFLDHDPRGTGAGRFRELVDGGRVGILDRQRQERRTVTAGQRLFQARDQFLDRVGRRWRLNSSPGRMHGGESKARQRQEKAKGHGWSHIRPLRGGCGAWDENGGSGFGVRGSWSGPRAY